MQWRKDSLFKSDVGKAGQLHKSKKLEYFLTSFNVLPETKVSSNEPKGQTSDMTQ